MARLTHPSEALSTLHIAVRQQRIVELIAVRYWRFRNGVAELTFNLVSWKCPDRSAQWCSDRRCISYLRRGASGGQRSWNNSSGGWRRNRGGCWRDHRDGNSHIGLLILRPH